MKYLIFILAINLQAQTVSLVGTLKAGQSSTISINVSGFTGKNIAAFQFSSTVPSGTTIQPVVVSPPPIKSLSCNISGTNLICVISGTDTTAIVDSTIATLTLTSTTSAVLSSTNLLGATGTGSAIVINPSNPCDVNGDGVVDIKDVQNVINQIIGVIVPAFTDLDGNGKTDIIDLQRVVNAVVPNGVCRIGQ